MLGSGIRDADVGDRLEPGGAKGRILDIEIPAESFTEFSHSYSRGRKKKWNNRLRRLGRGDWGKGTLDFVDWDGRQTLEPFGMGL